ncbi:MAG: proteasome assembly chaperone family protein, partial [Halohasta sp.]
MAQIDILDESITLDRPVLIEGFPGVGLVGKIAVDHIVDHFDMVHYANVFCEGIPPVATYQQATHELVTPVRLYADADRDLLALQSDVPIQPAAAIAFGECVAEWFATENVTPIYLSGLPRQVDDAPALYGIGTGDGVDLLAETDIEPPSEMGLISGPTGALLAQAVEHDRPAVGLVVEADPQFPDPIAAQAVIERGIEPLAGIEIATEDLSVRAEEIEAARQQLIQRMQQATEESTRAQPLRMYQ